MLPHPDAYFAPKTAIRDEKTELFRGRADLLTDAIRAVSGEGSSVFVYGERGVGKTSLAWRIMTILERAAGDTFSHYTNLLPNKTYRCAWLETKDYMGDLGGLLLSLVRPQPDSRSMSQRFGKAYQDKGFLAHVKRTYEIGLPKVASMKWEFDDSNDTPKYAAESREASRGNNQIRFLFEDVVQTISDKYRGDEIVLFIDEFDVLRDNHGVGSLIKTTSGVRFVIVGVADNLDDLLTDHPSVDRKFYGSDIFVPGLLPENIKEIFTCATEKTNGALTFSDDYLSDAIRYSGGYPWIAQQLGYHSVMRHRFFELAALHLTSEDFKHAIDVVTRIHLKGKSGISLANIIDSSTKVEILEALWSKEGWMREEDLNNKVHPRLRKFFRTQLPELVESRLLKKGPADSYKFSDGITRILVRFYLDSEREEAK